MKHCNTLHFRSLLRRSLPRCRRKHRRGNEKLPPLHSITSSARPSVRPSTFAVLRLITSSDFGTPCFHPRRYCVFLEDRADLAWVARSGSGGGCCNPAIAHQTLT